MGRIAEALKRAQQERVRCAAGEAAASQYAADTFAEGGILAPESFPAFVVSTPPILPDQVAPEVVMLHDPTCRVAERYRAARTRLLSGQPGGKARIFAITSSLPGEGKTITTANLGFSLAELRHLRVAVIDCDFRQQGLTASCNAKGRPGLAEVIQGQAALADVCVPLVRENLFLIPAGNPKSITPSELLAEPSAAAVFREINGRFHYGLIDTPPASTVADIGLVAPLCHSVVIVLRMGKTPEHLLQRCVRMLQANHVAIAGSILVGYCEQTMACRDGDYYQGRL
ncbi:MAG TPA: CpsD/CapB family tyrosine-protein kinase [Phycisphaerae bacterium]|nr:CpsD/CapB family tyrosine-protein kinase [Phycisphaerae bacterium]HOJ75439.1 CpsD/CapB family tyrosine-protein kinase [Phycisphaerae bacterium]HON65861.1 CpsD/CapB family tyrosine-protein kinase [Phycisphaerae bacterium]HPU28181.1 CpsD/CapB family tyrosine-protein kinase [Phycisphaerae bacterium]HPZ97586.1 CpsD/CapB family tyrosine-protein kinase [Phycisphaerae bacterium]